MLEGGKHTLNSCECSPYTFITVPVKVTKENHDEK